jgi:hypothetical protein
MSIAVSQTHDLRFVPAVAVQGPAIDFSELPVETRDDRPVGRLAGVVVDLVCRELRYIVVESSRWAECAMRLVPFSIATIDRDRRALRLDALGSLETCAEFDPRVIPPLSPEDAMAVG